MPDSGPAEPSDLLSQLNAQVAAAEPAPSAPNEAMALYVVAARLVELQLELAEQGDCDEDELMITRDVLIGTHRMLSAALDHVEARDAALATKPTLQVVDGGDHGGRPRRRRPRRPHL